MAPTIGHFTRGLVAWKCPRWPGCCAWLCMVALRPWTSGDTAESMMAPMADYSVSSNIGLSSIHGALSIDASLGSGPGVNLGVGVSNCLPWELAGLLPFVHVTQCGQSKGLRPHRGQGTPQHEGVECEHRCGGPSSAKSICSVMRQSIHPRWPGMRVCPACVCLACELCSFFLCCVEMV
jgi:hypothetical protein